MTASDLNSPENLKKRFDAVTKKFNWTPECNKTVMLMALDRPDVKNAMYQIYARAERAKGREPYPLEAWELDIRLQFAAQKDQKPTAAPAAPPTPMIQNQPPRSAP